MFANKRAARLALFALVVVLAGSVFGVTAGAVSASGFVQSAFGILLKPETAAPANRENATRNRSPRVRTPRSITGLATEPSASNLLDAPRPLLAGCTGTSTNMTCNAAGPISLNSTGATGTNPQTASIYPSNNVVSGMTGTINSIQVRLNGFTHTWLHNNDMVLVAPNGNRFVFWSDVGTAGNIEGNPILNFTLTISDSGATDLPQGTPVNNTTYRPRNYNTNLGFFDIFPAPANFSATAGNSAAPTGTQTFTGAFNGIDPNGTWQLYIALDSGPDTGSLQSWDLIIGTTVANAATTTSLTSSANPAVIPLSGNSQGTITATVTSGGNPVTLGAVTFFNGSQTLAANVPLNASGQASFTFNTTGSTAPVLGEGSYNITANYSGATGFGASNGNLTQTVDRATQRTGNTFCNTGKITVPQAVGAATVYPSKIFVSGLGGATQSVVLDLKGFTNPATDDVNMLLVSPTGQKFVPFAYISRFDAATVGANITLDDLSGNILPTTGPVASGTYRPSHGLNGTTASPVTFVSPAPAAPYNSPEPFGSATFTSTFSGANPNGTWTLYTVNWGGTNVAGVREITNGWCVTIGSSTDPATTTTPSVNPTPSALNQSVTVSALVTNSSNGAPVNGVGTVTFKEGNTVLAGPIAVGANGVASFNTSTLSQGAHFIDAFYSGAPGSFGVSNGQVLHYVDAATTNPSAGRFCNTTPLTFQNALNSSGLPYPTRISTSGLAGTISKVTLELNGLSHQFPDDLDMMLSGPNGNSLIAFSDVGGSNAISNVNLVLDSTATTALPDSLAITGGTFRPTDFQVGGDSFAAPAPTTSVFSASTTTLGTAFNNGNPNGIWTLWTSNDGAGAQGGGSLGSGWCVNVTTTSPQLTVSKTHVGNFTQGQTGAQYTVTVGSSGPGSTVGTISVVDTPPPGLTITGMSGNGWSCTVGTRTCTTTSQIAANSTLPPITVTVDVATNATSPLTNSVTVSGGGALSATATDSTLVNQVADMIIAKSTSSTFFQGGTATYTLIASNIGAGTATANFTVTDALPTGLSLTGVIAAAPWNCSASTATQANCVYGQTLAGSSSASAITLNVAVAANAPTSITNTAIVAGGGEIITNNNSSGVSSTVTSCQSSAVTVTSNGDTGAGSLRDAVSTVCPGGTISFAPALDGPITVSTGQIAIDRSLTILGPTNKVLTIRNTTATPTSRIFQVNSGTTTIQNLNLTGGTTSAGGSGILVAGGALNLNNSTVYGNTATTGNGGGIAVQSGASATLTNSTVSGNSASNGGGIANQGVLNVVNSTITGNSASANGGGVTGSGGVTNVRNSIIAGNTGATGPDFSGGLASEGFNLIGSTAGASISGNTTGNVLNTTARLAPLGYYGGPTLTHALLSTSPAINAGNAAPSPTTDQRGAARVGNADIGAFELNSSSNGGVFSATLPDGLVNTGYSFTLVPEAGATTYCRSSGNFPLGITGLPACPAPLADSKDAAEFAPAAAVVLGGTPTQGGVFDFAVTATNAGTTVVTNYRLNVVAPTAANVAIGGRVTTPDGRGLINAVVTITDQNGNARSTRTGTFGFFRFDEVTAGAVYVVDVRAKRYQFVPQVVIPTDSVTDIVFTAN